MLILIATTRLQIAVAKMPETAIAAICGMTVNL